MHLGLHIAEPNARRTVRWKAGADHLHLFMVDIESVLSLVGIESVDKGL